MTDVQPQPHTLPPSGSRRPRESGDPGANGRPLALDSRLRGNDGLGASLARADHALASPRVAAALFFALVALATAPVWLWPIPRGNDIVNHWARLTLYTLSPDDPLRALYHVHFGLIPNLGVDALYVALSPILSAQSVARLALALAIALPALGAWALHRALFAKLSPSIWLVPFLSYNVATSVGLLNFALGAGIALLGVAYAVARGDRLRPLDVVVFNLIGAALFFCHLIAWAMFALTLGLTLIGSLPVSPRVFVRRAGMGVAAQLLPLVLIAMREMPPSTYSMGDRSGFNLIYAPIATMTASDLIAEVVLLGLVALLVLLGARPHPRMRLALIGYLLFATLIPSSHSAATLIDARLKVYVWYFALAVTSLKSGESFRFGLATLASVVTAARLAWIAPAWIEFQQRAAIVREALASLPAGARALVVSPSGCEDQDLPMLGALTTFAVIDRHAYINTLFAQTGIQPAAPADPTLDGGPTLPMDARWLTEAGRAALPAHLVNAPWAAAFRDWRGHFDYVVDAHGACASTLAAPRLTRLSGAAGLDVYRAD